MAERPPIKVTVSRDGAAVVVYPEGDIGYHEAPTFRQSIRSGFDLRPSRVVVDLAGVPYMATPGLATLVEFLQGSKKSQIPLVLCGLNDRVRGIFEIARLHTVFKIVATRSDALVA
ncbi:MAG: STAS domain-containing protein [Phycisphaerales bacterium]